MNKDIYKKAVDDIPVDQSFINDTISKITTDVDHKKKVSINRYISVTACITLVVLGLLLYYKISLKYQNKPIAKSTEAVNNNFKPSDNIVNQLDDDPLPEIKNNYVAFNPTQYDNAKKIDAPGIRMNYTQLKNESDAIIMCTIKKIGVYKKITDKYNFKADTGRYIYTAKIDKILSGTIQNKVGDLIPISEIAFAWPTLDGDKIANWNFYSYSLRAEEVGNLKSETQYIMFLSKKDETGCYTLSSCGFGVFTIDYINNLSQSYTLKEIINSGKENYPLVNDYLYKVCSLNIKEDFLK